MKELHRALWRAPELIRNPNPPARGTQKGDVYSFGIVLYEIIGRAGPWGAINMSDAGKRRFRNLLVVLVDFNVLHITLSNICNDY